MQTDFKMQLESMLTNSIASAFLTPRYSCPHGCLHVYAVSLVSIAHFFCQWFWQQLHNQLTTTGLLMHELSVGRHFLTRCLASKPDGIW